MLCRIKAFIKSCDQVGKETSLSFNGSSKIKTFCGGLLTFIVAVFIGATSYFFSKEIFLRQDPSVRTSNVPIEDSIIRLKEFPIAINIGDGRGKDLTFDSAFNRALSIVGQLREINHAANKESVRIYTFMMKRCNILEFGLLGQIYENLVKVTNNYLCIDFDSLTTPEGKLQTKDPIINGILAERESTVLMINIYRCDETKDPGCSVVLEKQGTFFINIRFIETMLNTAVYDHPLNYKQETKNVAVSPDLYIRQFINFKTNELVTDDGWIFEKADILNFVQVDEKYQEISSYTSVTRLLINIYGQTIREKVSTNRKYIKIPEVLANLGGIFKVAVSVMKLIAAYFSEYEFYEEVRNIVEKKKENSAQINNLVKIENSDAQLTIKNIKTFKTTIPKHSMAYFILFRACIFCKSKIEENRQDALKYLEIRFLINKMIETEELNQINPAILINS